MIFKNDTCTVQHYKLNKLHVVRSTYDSIIKIYLFTTYSRIQCIITGTCNVNIQLMHAHTTCTTVMYHGAFQGSVAVPARGNGTLLVEQPNFRRCPCLLSSIL